MTDAPLWVPVVIMFGLVALAFLGMWLGWRRRARKHHLPPLVTVPDGAVPDGVVPDGEVPDGEVVPLLLAEGRYFGTTVAGDWLDRVVARGLGARSECRLCLSAEALDVQRPGASASFRVPVDVLRGARHDQGIAGKVVPPHGVLVVTWQHGDLLLDSGFRLSGAAAEQHDDWVREVSALSRESA